MTTAAITPGYAGHPDSDLLAMLATEIAPMGLGGTVAFGSQADAENVTGAARVIFIDVEWQAMPRKIQPGDGNASFDGWRTYDVHMRAPEMGVLWRLFCKVTDALDDLVSWSGADVSKAAKIGQRSNGAGSGGFGLVFPVVIKGPVYREVHGTATAATVTQSVGLTGGNDQASSSRTEIV
jgi:hypothetical protein